MPAAAPAGWTRLAGEDFTRSAALGQFSTVYGANWAGYTAGATDTSGNGVYAPDKVLSTANGVLNYDLHTDSATGKPVVAAPMPRGYSSQLYGRMSVRARADAIDGYKIAFLYWPSTGNWAEGEIDGPETGNTDLQSSPYLASKQLGNLSSTFQKVTAPGVPNMNEWHTYTVEWTPDSITYLVDGVKAGAITDKAYIPTTKMRFVMQAETEIKSTPPASSLRGNVQVDWVTLDSYTP
jgi:beta-glucanase (GH16 family)